MQDRKLEALPRIERCRLLRKELYDASPDEKNAINLMLAEARVGNLERAKELSDQLGQSTVTNGELQLVRARTLAKIAELPEGELHDKLKSEPWTHWSGLLPRDAPIRLVLKSKSNFPR